MRRGLTVRMVVASALLVVVVGTTFAFLRRLHRRRACKG